MLVRGDRNGQPARVVEDGFTAVGDTDPLPDGPVIVSLKRYLTEKEALWARPGCGASLGVRLETAEPPEKLGAGVQQLGAIVLHVPHFKDGRGYSQARLLRTRLHYKGEIRVSGHVLKDQLTFYARVGVDTFELTQNLSLSDIEAALHEISNVYQPSVDGRTTIRELRAARTHQSGESGEGFMRR